MYEYQRESANRRWTAVSYLFIFTKQLQQQTKKRKKDKYETHTHMYSKSVINSLLFFSLIFLHDILYCIIPVMSSMWCRNECPSEKWIENHTTHQLHSIFPGTLWDVSKNFKVNISSCMEIVSYFVRCVCVCEHGARSGHLVWRRFVRCASVQFSDSSKKPQKKKTVNFQNKNWMKPSDLFSKMLKWRTFFWFFVIIRFRWRWPRTTRERPLCTVYMHIHIDPITLWSTVCRLKIQFISR